MIFNCKKVCCFSISLLVLLPQIAVVHGQDEESPDPNNDELCPKKLPIVYAPGKCNGLAYLTDCNYGPKPCSHNTDETCYKTTCTCFGDDLACTADSDPSTGGGEGGVPILPETKPPLNDEVSIAGNSELCPAEVPDFDEPWPSCDNTLLTSDCNYEPGPCMDGSNETCYMYMCTCFMTNELVCAVAGGDSGGGDSGGGDGGGGFPCGSPDDSCNQNYQECIDLQNAGCAEILVMESCPLQYDCADITDAPFTAPPVTGIPITSPPVTAAPAGDDDEEEGGFPLCFPGDALVQVKASPSLDTTKSIPMKDLKIGDMVRVQGDNNIPKYEPVYSFGHKNIHDTSKFLEVKTSSSSKVVLSSHHMVYETTQQKFIPASEIRDGHELQFDDTSTKVVTSIRTVEKQGMYAPFTPSGTIVVNSIVASSFVAIPILEFVVTKLGISYQWMAHTGEFPHRLVCHYMGSCQKTETYDAKTGINQGWCTIPLQILNYDLSSTSTAVQWLLAFFVLVTLFAFYITEQVLFHNGHALIVGFVFIGMTTTMMKSSTLLGSKKKQL